METFSRLETQTTSDAQQWGSEKNQRVKDKEDMQQTSTTLKTEIRTLQKTCGGLSEPCQVQCKGVATGADGVLDDYLRTDSPSRFEAELRSLQHANANLEEALEHVRQEYTQLFECIENLGGIGKNMKMVLWNRGADGDLSRSLDGGERVIDGR